MYSPARSVPRGPAGHTLRPSSTACALAPAPAAFPVPAPSSLCLGASVRVPAATPPRADGAVPLAPPRPAAARPSACKSPRGVASGTALRRDGPTTSLDLTLFPQHRGRLATLFSALRPTVPVPPGETASHEGGGHAGLVCRHILSAVARPGPQLELNKWVNQRLDRGVRQGVQETQHLLEGLRT